MPAMPCERIRRRDEDVAADDEVAVAIAIRRRAEVGRILRHHPVIEILGMNQVGIGMMAAEIGKRRSVDHRSSGRAQGLLQDRPGIRSRDRMHRIEAHAESAGEHVADHVEIEKLLHQRLVVGDRIEDLDTHAVELAGPDPVERDIGRIGDQVAFDLLGFGEDRFGDLLGRRPSIGDVVLDAEIAVGSAGIVARRKHDAAEGLVLADDIGGGGRREEPALSDQHAPEAIGRRHLDRGLDHFAIMEAPVAANHQRLALEAFERIEDRLDEVLGIVLLLEGRHFLAQAGSAGLLVGEGLRGDSLDHRASHQVSRSFLYSRA
jgi:hypothetical protein